MSHKPKRNLFAEALEREDAQTIAQMLADRDFTILEVELEPGTGDRAGLTADVDGAPVLVAFTARKFAADFLAVAGDDMPVDDDGAAPAFVIKGRSLFETLPEEFGVLLNPESEEKCYVLFPEMAQRVKQIVLRM